MRKCQITKADFMHAECEMLNLLDRTVYLIRFSKKEPFVAEAKVVSFDIDDERKFFYNTAHSRDGILISDGFCFTDICQTVFLTKETAHQAIAMFNALFKEQEESQK